MYDKANVACAGRGQVHTEAASLFLAAPVTTCSVFVVLGLVSLVHTSPKAHRINTPGGAVDTAAARAVRVDRQRRDLREPPPPSR